MTADLSAAVLSAITARREADAHLRALAEKACGKDPDSLSHPSWGRDWSQFSAALSPQRVLEWLDWRESVYAQHIALIERHDEVFGVCSWCADERFPCPEITAVAALYLSPVPTKGSNDA